MAHYVLVHGAWHGAWCWDKLVPLLQQAGHSVVALDLPGHGADTTPLAEVTMQAYADRVCAVLDAAAVPVILVGHSMGGAVISAAAEQRPNKVRKLVYLCAFLLKRGTSLLTMVQGDTQSTVLAELDFAPDGSAVTVKAAAQRELFYSDCTAADTHWAQAQLGAQPAAPLATPLRLTAANWGRLPRVYLECTLDRAIPLSLQRAMVAALPCERVITLDAGHSPFLSVPALLASHLNTLAAAQGL
jgi:pimeloyl-ACP methyl ester carboxylesterase